MGRPSKPPEDKLVTLSVRIPHTSLVLLDRIIEGEREYLRKRHLPTHGVNRSTAFRAIWELGELEYVLQRATLWVTRRTNRYTVARAADMLGWDADTLRQLLEERGIDVPDEEPPAPGPTGAPDEPGSPGPSFLV